MEAEIKKTKVTAERKPRVKKEKTAPAVEPEMKVFRTYYDVLADKACFAFVVKAINDLIHQRKTRPAAPIGYHYIRGWYEKMEEDGQLNAAFFVKHYPLIQDKVCTLASDRRTVINNVVGKAILDTLNFYKAEKVVKS